MSAPPSLWKFGSRTTLDGSIHVGWRDLTTQKFLSLSQLSDTQHGDKVPVFVRREAGWKV